MGLLGLQGGTISVHYCVSHVVPCNGNLSVIICLHYISYCSTRRWGYQFSFIQCYYDIWRLSQCYKLKHGFCYIYSLYEGVVLWPFWNWHEGTIHYFVSHVVPCNGKLSLIIESVFYFLFLFYFPERLIDIDLVCCTWNYSPSYRRQAGLSR